MTVTKISKADTGRELDLIRAGFSSDVQRELGSTMLVIRMDLTDFDRMVNELGAGDVHRYSNEYRRGYEEGHEDGYEVGLEAADDGTNDKEAS